jgi:hypothetical protein
VVAGRRLVLPRVHFSPVMGSPAVSCSRRISMASIISGVFFPPASARRPLGVCGLPPRSSVLLLPLPDGHATLSDGAKLTSRD